MGAALKYNQAQVPQQVGEVARLKILRGSDMGSIYVLKTLRATLGRGEENDVVLLDLKSSRKHIEFSRDQYGTWTVQDLGSANGIILNGTVTRQSKVKKGDTIIVGDTTIEFLPAPVMQLAAPQNLSNQQLQAGSPLTGLTGINMAGVASSAGASADSGPLGSLSPEKKKILIYVVIGAALWLFLDGDQKKPPVKAKDQKEDKKDDDLSNYLPSHAETKTDAAESFFRAGFREFREKNYLRAKIQFETALQIAPYHRLASIYMKHCERSIEEEVKFHLIQGNKDKDSGKFKSAKGHFEAILRLLYRDVENPHYLEARDQLKVIQMKMKGGTDT